MIASPPRVSLVIPALNEEQGLAAVLEEVPRELFAEVIVADNGSTDRTAEVAQARGARVVSEPQRGYGRACLKALAALDPETEIVVFMDADASDVPAEASSLVAPIARGEADLVIGARRPGGTDAGALGWHQRAGNGLAVLLIRLLFGFRYTDLGPFRAIRRASLEGLAMREPTFGWTVEMQVKALQRGLRVEEIPVRYRARIGRSKISGTLGGTLKAGTGIIWTILRLRLAG